MRELSPYDPNRPHLRGGRPTPCLFAVRNFHYFGNRSNTSAGNQSGMANPVAAERSTRR